MQVFSWSVRHAFKFKTSLSFNQKYLLCVMLSVELETQKTCYHFKIWIFRTELSPSFISVLLGNNYILKIVELLKRAELLYTKILLYSVFVVRGFLNFKWDIFSSSGLWPMWAYVGAYVGVFLINIYYPSTIHVTVAPTR